MNEKNIAPVQRLDVGVSQHIGSYSDASVVSTANEGIWLFTSGTPGIDEDGQFGNDIAAQCKLAWDNALKVLTKAGLSANDIIKVNTTLTEESFIQPYVKIRKEILGDIRPSFMLTIGKMVKPEILVEIEVIAYGTPKNDANK